MAETRVGRRADWRAGSLAEKMDDWMMKDSMMVDSRAESLGLS